MSLFKKMPHFFYLENSIHCHLYHLLAKSGLNQQLGTKAGYLIGQVQKEYPPIVPEAGGRRGRYDLVVFDSETTKSIDWWNHRRHDGSRNGVPVAPVVAFEVGLNKGLVNDPGKVSRNISVVTKEIDRLTAKENGLERGILLYFYRFAPYQRPSIEAVLKILRQRLLGKDAANAYVVATGFDDVGVGPQSYQPVAHLELRVDSGRELPDDPTHAG